MDGPQASKQRIKHGENASVIFEAVLSIVGSNFSRTFTPADVVQAVARMGYVIPPFTAECHIIAGSPNHKQTERYTGYRNKYWWIRGSGQTAEFRLRDPNAPAQVNP